MWEITSNFERKSKTGKNHQYLYQSSLFDKSLGNTTGINIKRNSPGVQRKQIYISSIKIGTTLLEWFLGRTYTTQNGVFQRKKLKSILSKKHLIFKNKIGNFCRHFLDFL